MIKIGKDGNGVSFIIISSILITIIILHYHALSRVIRWTARWLSIVQIRKGGRESDKGGDE